MREETAKKYTKCYGHITAGDAVSMSRWSWIENPWPWELSAQGRD